MSCFQMLKTWLWQMFKTNKQAKKTHMLTELTENQHKITFSSNRFCVLIHCTLHNLTGGRHMQEFHANMIHKSITPVLAYCMR